MTLGKIIDWIGKNLSRIKTITLLVVVVFFSLSLVRNGCNRNDLNDMVERITGLDIRNDILMEDVKERDSLLIASELRVQELADSLSESLEREEVLEADYSYLEGEYESLSDSLLRIPADTSYKFLVDEAYPYPGEMKYPFNEPQVKGIHLTFLEKIKLDKMNHNLLDQILEKNNQLVLKSAVVEEKTMSMALMAESRQDLDSIIINKDEVIELQDEQIHKAKRSKTIWQIIGGAIIAVLAAFAIGGG